MNAILAKTVSEAQRDGDDQLPFVLAAYRATMHNSTGFTPNRLIVLFCEEKSWRPLM